MTFEAVKRSFVLPSLVQTSCVLQNVWTSSKHGLLMNSPSS